MTVCKKTNRWESSVVGSTRLITEQSFTYPSLVRETGLLNSKEVIDNTVSSR